MPLDCSVPTPRLDEVADRMAALLVGRRMSMAQIAQELGVPRKTVETVLRRRCERHGRRFRRVGYLPQRGAPRAWTVR